MQQNNLQPIHRCEAGQLQAIVIDIMKQFLTNSDDRKRRLEILQKLTKTTIKSTTTTATATATTTKSSVSSSLVRTSTGKCRRDDTKNIAFRHRDVTEDQFKEHYFYGESSLVRN